MAMQTVLSALMGKGSMIPSKKAGANNRFGMGQQAQDIGMGKIGANLKSAAQIAEAAKGPANEAILKGLGLDTVLSSIEGMKKRKKSGTTTDTLGG